MPSLPGLPGSPAAPFLPAVPTSPAGPGLPAKQDVVTQHNVPRYEKAFWCGLPTAVNIRPESVR